MGYETSCPATLYRWMVAAGELQRALWSTPGDTLHFHLHFLEAVALFYIRQQQPAIAKEVNDLRQHLREVGNVHTVKRELQTLFEPD